MTTNNSTRKSGEVKSSVRRRPYSRPKAVLRSAKPAAGRKSQAAKIGNDKDAIRFVALGGLEEIGRNMMFFEYRDEILLIDAGLQFPEDTTPGIDYIIPNTDYLELKKDKIKGLIITHGHYDHIGAIPYIMDRIGNPIIYATELTKEVIVKRQTEFPKSPQPVFEIIKAGEEKKISEHFSVKFFAVAHNIPDGVGMIIKTPVGNIVHPGEFKFDYDLEGKPRGLEVWEQVGKEGIHTLLLDSTGAGTPGWAVSERVVEAEIENLFKKAPGRIIIGTFSSLLDRIAEIIKIAEKLGRVVAISGRSMESNIEIARRLGFIKIKKGTLIPISAINRYRDDKVLIISTGAQGEENASLMKIANGEHRHVKIRPNDTIIFSSSVIPGNERSVQNLKDNLARQGAVIYDYKMLDIHSSGHAPQEELKAVMKLVKPKFFIPIHGYYFMRWQNAKLAQEALGLPPENTILSDNGVVVEIKKDSVRLTDEQIPASYVLVDGLGVGDVGEVVLRDRRALAEEGMLVIITTLSRRSGKVLKNPDIISRGFIYLKENQDLLDDIRRRIRGIIGRIPNRQSLDVDYVKTIIRDQISQFLYRRTKRRPMVLPVIIEV